MLAAQPEFLAPTQILNRARAKKGATAQRVTTNCNQRKTPARGRGFRFLKGRSDQN